MKKTLDQTQKEMLRGLAKKYNTSLSDWLAEPQEFDPVEAARKPKYVSHADDDDDEFEAAFDDYLDRRAEAVLRGAGRPRKSHD